MDISSVYNGTMVSEYGLKGDIRWNLSLHKLEYTFSIVPMAEILDQYIASMALMF